MKTLDSFLSLTVDSHFIGFGMEGAPDWPDELYSVDRQWLVGLYVVFHWFCVAV